MAPDKIYTDNRGVYAEFPIFSQTDANVEYIRKDVVDEMLKTAEDHAYFAGKEKIREELIDFLNDQIKSASEGFRFSEKMAYEKIIEKIESL